ncbi:Unconventional myosin-Id [Larimichthys crocea]|uniref:Uncharacterized protein n=1 Tax=Larimichthys crocea TaxID=215358 RepID=A0ACD3RT93_LARCR|nr:Unconventional myosin-Id [Larimichthys crocea]
MKHLYMRAVKSPGGNENASSSTSAARNNLYQCRYRTEFCGTARHNHHVGSGVRYLVFSPPGSRCRWWAWTLIKGLSPEEALQVRAKVASLEALKGQRADLGLQRAWEGNYLKRDSPDTASSFTLVSSELQRKDKFMRVLFSCNVRKINRFHKAEDRAVLITDRHLYKMDPLKQYKPMKSIPLYNVTGVSVSPGKDQLVVFHTKDSRDLIVCLQGMVPANESRIGELVGTLLSHFKSERRRLQVNIASPIQCSMNGRKCTIIVEPKINQSQPDFTRNRSGYILAVPGN